MDESSRLTKAWQWVRKQLDLIVLLVAAIFFTIRSAIGVSTPTEMNSILLAFLSLLAFSQIRERDQISSLGGFIKSRRTELLLTDFPADYYASRKRMTRSYFFAGVSMHRTLPTIEPELERLLSGDGRVRVLLPNPTNTALLEMIAATRNKNENVEAIATLLRGSIQRLERLADRGNFQIRITETLPRIGVNAIDLEHPGGLIMVQIYEFKAPHEQAPIFTLTREDGIWFRHYSDQIERLWEAGSSVPVDPNGPQS